MDKAFAQRLHSDSEGEFNPKAVEVAESALVNPAELAQVEEDARIGKATKEGAK